MSRITIYGSKKDRKAVLEFLQRRRIMDITEQSSEAAEFGFKSMNTGEQQSEFAHEKSAGERALEILDRYAPVHDGLLASFKGKKELSVEQYYKYVDGIPNVLSKVKHIIELADVAAENQGRIVRCRAVLDELAPWLGLDVPIDCRGTKSSACVIGSFSEQLTAEQIVERYNAGENVPPVYIEIVNSSVRQTCIFAVFSKHDADAAERRLRKIGFSRPRFSYSGVPADEARLQKEMITAAQKEIDAAQSSIKEYSRYRASIEFMVDYYAMRTEKYSVLGKLNQCRHVFMITGYVPERDVGAIAAVLEHKYSAAVETEPPDADAPVLLDNPYLAEPVEPIVETFAMPGKREIDPTSIMAVFYYVFFGMMLSDAAYGLIMTIGCAAVLRKFKAMDTGLRKSLRMFMYCGVSTTFWGILFGSWFGDAIPVVTETFFHHRITIAPLWFEPVQDPIKMLMFSFLLGIIHLFTGLGIKLYQCARAKDYRSMFSECIFWYMLVGGLIVYLFRVDMFMSMAGLSFRLPKAAANIAAVTAAIGAVGILLFTAKSGGAGKRLAKGAYALYGITGWLGDILSYSRLLALGLATGVIATVFNQMGTMFGSGIIGALIFIVVFVIGHAMNIGVNLLGAYVHTNRLQFVEFFGKFYEGGGRLFKPFAADTKYYKFKEEE